MLALLVAVAARGAGEPDAKTLAKTIESVAGDAKQGKMMVSPAQEDAILAYVPDNEQAETKAELKELNQGGDLNQQEISVIKKYFTPDLPLAKLITGVDPACLPEKCPNAFKACRRGSRDCEKRMECMQSHSPQSCWDAKLGDMGFEEGSLIMCGEKEQCVSFGIGNFHMSLLQTGGKLALQARDGAEHEAAARAVRSAEAAHRISVIDSSFAEVDDQISQLMDDPEEDEDDATAAQLQHDLGAIASGAKEEDFDAMLGKMQETQAKMTQGNQRLESLKLKLDGEEKRLAAERAAHPDAPLGPKVASFLENPEVTSFLETPTLAKLHQDLGDFLARVGAEASKAKEEAAENGADLKAKLQEASKKFSMENELLAPETRSALARAGVLTPQPAPASSFAESRERDTDGAQMLSSVDADGNISPEALMVIDQLAHAKMPKHEQFLEIMRGFQEAAGKGGEKNMTDMLESLKSFMVDAKEHGADNVLSQSINDNVAHLMSGIESGHLTPESAMQQLEKNGGLQYGKSDAATMSLSMGAMLGLDMAHGANKQKILDAMETGPLAKYMKTLGLTDDGKMYTELKASMAKGEKPTEAEMEQILPPGNVLIQTAVSMLQDPAATGMMKQLGFPVPDIPPELLQVLAKVDPASSAGQMRTETH